MEVNFENYTKNHCQYCLYKKSLCCNNCISTNGYISRPSGFKTENKLASDYFEILEKYTKALSSLGLEIIT